MTGNTLQTWLSMMWRMRWRLLCIERAAASGTACVNSLEGAPLFSDLPNCLFRTSFSWPSVSTHSCVPKTLFSTPNCIEHPHALMLMLNIMEGIGMICNVCDLICAVFLQRVHAASALQHCHVVLLHFPLKKLLAEHLRSRSLQQLQVRAVHSAHFYIYD